jgi:hypothetical protein
MSRYAPDQISRLSWRMAVAGLVIVASAAMVAALLIARQGQALTAALTPVRVDEQWAIRSGSVEAGRLVLRPPARSISLALHPIESSAYTLQTRVAFNSPRGAAGLIVQADDLDHFSAFLISGDGYFRVSDYHNGIWSDRVAWRAWPHIRRDGNANVLRAECQSGACTFFVNDEWTWQEHALPAARRIGLIADAQAASDPFEARFDQIGWQP